MRKVIQLTGVEATIFALCDDGTIWRWAVTGYGGEKRERLPVPEVPQDKIKKQKVA